MRKLAHLLYDGPLDHEEKSRDDSLCNFVRDTEIFLSYVKGIKLKGIIRLSFMYAIINYQFLYLSIIVIEELVSNYFIFAINLI